MTKLVDMRSLTPVRSSPANDSKSGLSIARRRRFGWAAGLGLLAAGLIGVDAADAAALSEIGFIHGLTLRGPHAESQVYFPLPNGSGDADLAIVMTPSAAIDQLSSVTVYVGDEPLATIPTRDGARTVHVAVPARLAEGDFLRVRFAADQALRRDEQCFDNDNPAVWTHIGPATALNVAGIGDPGIGSLWRGLGGAVSMSLPAEPTLADLQTGLILATAITQRGGKPSMVGADDPRARIRVGRASVPLSVEWRSELVANSSLAQPVPQTRFGRILVADPGAARALVAAYGTLGASQTAQISGEIRPALALSSTDSISLAEMGLHPATLGVYGTAFVAMEIPFDRLPTGRHPVAMQLFARGTQPPLDEALVVTLSVGNRLLWSQTYRNAVELDGVRINLPEDLVRHHMLVTLRVVRVGSHRVCGADDALTFDLRDTSRFLLADGGTSPPNFAAFAMPGDHAALVRYDVPPISGVASIPLVARLLSDAGARAAALDVVGPGVALDRPFIVVAQAPPSELAGNAPARPEQGRVVIDRPGEGTRVLISGASAYTVVQLTTAGVIPGLWVSPGAAATLAHPSPLSAGDVAVYDSTGALPVSFETRTAGAFVEQPRGTVAEGLLQRWRSELFVIAWIAVTLFVLLVVLRLRRNRVR